jgi:hypothetical protein
MTVAVVAGSNNDNRFAVIDFSVPTSPADVLVPAPFSGGCMVDCSGVLAAVGNYNGGQVAIFDISNPAAPVLKGTANTILNGIGAISSDGSHVLVGEVNGSRSVLIDVTNPGSPSILSTFSTAVASISAIALRGTLAVAAGPAINPYFVVLNYANPASPTQVQFTPGTGGVYFGGAITCDLDATHAALADYSGGKIYLFDVSGATLVLLGQYSSDQAGVASISISGAMVAASSTNDTTITLVSFQNPASPTASDTAAGLGGGVVVKLAGSDLVAGAVNGLDVKLFSVSGTSAAPLGTMNTTLGSIATLGFTSFTPQIAVTPASLAFGAVNVNTTSPAQAITVTNTGTAPLNVTALTTSSPRYVASPSGTLPSIAPGHSATVQVTFTPTAVQSYSATLTMTTNDPSHPTVSVPLTGSGGQAAATWTPASLDFGAVETGATASLNLTITNSGSATLHVTGITASPPVFTASPAQLSVPPGGSQTIQVTFSPVATGSYPANLDFQTDDPSHASVSVPMTGTGIVPTVSWTPTSIDFGTIPSRSTATQDLLITNNGTVALHVTNMQIAYPSGQSDGFTASPTSLTIPPGQTGSIAVTFTTQFVWPFGYTSNANLTFQADNPARTRGNVSLSGSEPPLGCLTAPAALTAHVYRAVTRLRGTRRP